MAQEPKRVSPLVTGEQHVDDQVLAHMREAGVGKPYVDGMISGVASMHYSTAAHLEACPGPPACWCTITGPDGRPYVSWAWLTQQLQNGVDHYTRLRDQL